MESDLNKFDVEGFVENIKWRKQEKVPMEERVKWERRRRDQREIFCYFKVLRVESPEKIQINEYRWK